VNRSPAGLDPSEHAVRALVVDAHEPTRLGLAMLLERQAWVSRCDQATDQREASLLARRHRPDVAILDISNMGPFVGLATSALRDSHPGVTIVLSSRCGNAPAPPAGASAAAFLPPTADAATALATIRGAVLGDAAAPPPAPAPSSVLTAREREVLELLATGATNREIAARLHLGPDAIKKHAAAVYRKLGVRNRTEAAQRALELFAA
jgi:DNA-binding NarL/FixJ family response regulator